MTHGGKPRLDSVFGRASAGEGFENMTLMWETALLKRVDLKA
jgi:hypothetical protein